MSKLFVFDTNVLISAHLLKHSVSRKAYDVAFKNGSVLYSEETLKEFTDIFIQPKFDKYVSLSSRLFAINEFEKRNFMIWVTNNIKACRDQKDDKFLSLAVAASANCIISGDNDLLVLNPFRNIPIVSPSDFLTLFNK